MPEDFFIWATTIQLSLKLFLKKVVGTGTFPKQTETSHTLFLNNSITQDNIIITDKFSIYVFFVTNNHH